MTTCNNVLFYGQNIKCNTNKQGLKWNLKFFSSKIKDDTHQLRKKTQNFAYICLWQTTQTQSVVRVVNSRQALQTRSLQTRQGAPRFVMRPSSVLQRAQWRLDSCSRGGVGRLWLFCSNWYCCWYWICCCCCCCCR